MANLPTKFNLRVIDESKRGRVEMHTHMIKTLMRTTAGQIVEIGVALLQVKELLDHGQFEAWLQQEFAWTERTARNFMSVAERFKSEKFSDLYVAPSVLYLLAAPSTPQAAVDEFFKRARGGERITVEGARSLIVEHKPKAKAKPALRPPSAPSTNQQGFYQRWQEYAQRDPKSVHFATVGENDSLWLTFEGDAVRVARLLGLRLQKFTLPGDAIAVRECVLLQVSDPKPAWWEGMYVALESNVHWYPETDTNLLTIAENQLTISQVGETTPIEAPEMPSMASDDDIDSVASVEPEPVKDAPPTVPVITSAEGFPIPGARPPLQPNGLNGVNGSHTEPAAQTLPAATPHLTEVPTVSSVVASVRNMTLSDDPVRDRLQKASMLFEAGLRILSEASSDYRLPTIDRALLHYQIERAQMGATAQVNTMHLVMKDDILTRMRAELADADNLKVSAGLLMMKLVRGEWPVVENKAIA